MYGDNFKLLENLDVRANEKMKKEAETNANKSNINQNNS